MTQDTASMDCPPERLAELVEAASRDGAKGLALTERLLASYGRDPQLQFLHGSLLASAQRYGEARQAMQRALDIAPDYAIARFQLGLLALSSGDAAAAEATLRPLEALPPDHPLRLFAEGLQHMAADEFPEAIACLEAGQARNGQIPAINRDMQLLIDEMRARMAEPTQEPTAEPTSSVHFLLQQYAKRTPDA